MMWPRRIHSRGQELGHGTPRSGCVRQDGAEEHLNRKLRVRGRREEAQRGRSGRAHALAGWLGGGLRTGKAAGVGYRWEEGPGEQPEASQMGMEGRGASAPSRKRSGQRRVRRACEALRGGQPTTDYGPRCRTAVPGIHKSFVPKWLNAYRCQNQPNVAA